MAEQTQWLHVLIDVASGIAEESTAFWSSALAWPLGEPWPGHPEFRSFTPPAGDSEAVRLVGLGAERLGTGHGCIVLRDTVGMVFCVTRNSPDDP